MGLVAVATKPIPKPLPVVVPWGPAILEGELVWWLTSIRM